MFVTIDTDVPVLDLLVNMIAVGFSLENVVSKRFGIFRGTIPVSAHDALAVVEGVKWVEDEKEVCI